LGVTRRLTGAASGKRSFTPFSMHALGMKQRAGQQKQQIESEIQIAAVSIIIRRQQLSFICSFYSPKSQKERS
jgi:hypothetical protein